MSSSEVHPGHLPEEVMFHIMKRLSINLKEFKLSKTFFLMKMELSHKPIQARSLESPEILEIKY